MSDAVKGFRRTSLLAAGAAMILAFIVLAAGFWEKYKQAWATAHARDELLRKVYAPAEYNQAKLFWGTLGVIFLGLIAAALIMMAVEKVQGKYK